jgi:hypothetical protein
MSFKCLAHLCFFLYLCMDACLVMLITLSCTSNIRTLTATGDINLRRAAAPQTHAVMHITARRHSLPRSLR